MPDRITTEHLERMAETLSIKSGRKFDIYGETMTNHKAYSLQDVSSGCVTVVHRMRPQDLYWAMYGMVLLAESMNRAVDGNGSRSAT